MVLDSKQIHVQLLGPLSASLGTSTVTPNAAKQREVLALLALNAGRVVSVSTLVEELWGDRPPRSSANTLQTYIFQTLRMKDARWVVRFEPPDSRGSTILATVPYWHGQRVFAVQRS